MGKGANVYKNICKNFVILNSIENLKNFAYTNNIDFIRKIS